MEIQKILVPVDFSEFSRKSVEAARKIARRYGASVTLIHIIVTPHGTVGDSRKKNVLEKQNAFIRQQFQVQYGDKLEKEIQDVSFILITGVSPVDSLQEYLQDHPHDLVVMGTHGQTGFRFFVQGSVVEKMVRFSSVPILTIPQALQNIRFKRILAPLDFSVHSQKALEYTISFAKHHNAKIVFMHVIEQENYPSFSSAEEESIFEIEPSLQQSIVENLREFVADTVDESYIEDFVVTEGVVHREIVNLCKSFDVMIISTHGLTGLEYIQIGGTAEKVVRWASCPVLVVKRDEY